MADLFTLVGTIAIDCKEAENKIDALIEKANTLNVALGGTTHVTSGTGTTGTTGSTTGTSNSKEQTANGVTVATGTSAAGYIKGRLFYEAAEFLGKAVLGVAKEGFSYNKDKEKYIADFKTMTNSTWEEAEAFFNELNELSISTPLNMSSIGYAANRFLALGYKPDDLLKQFQVLGDVARGDNTTFERLVKAVSDVFGKTGLKAQEKNQFAETGVPIFELLAELWGEPYETQAERDAFNSYWLGAMERGGMISPDDVWNALEKSTQEGGRFHNAMAIAMETYGGQEEKIAELASQTSGKAFSNYFNLVKEKLLPLVADGLDFYNEILNGKYGTVNATMPYLSTREKDPESYSTEEEYEEELRRRYEDAGKLSPEKLEWTSDWAPASSMQNTDAMATSIKSAVEEAMPGAIAAGFENANINITVTTSDVRLDTGALVGRITPQVNAAIGALGVLYERGVVD